MLVSPQIIFPLHAVYHRGPFFDPLGSLHIPRISLSCPKCIASTHTRTLMTQLYDSSTVADAGSRVLHTLAIIKELSDMDREGDMVTSVAHMNGLLRAHGGILLSTFPNVGIALRLYLTLPVTNCEGERSFSTLARIKNHLRASMGQ